jgi:predicted lipoprotein with Yx(FWY)xxD motif
MSRLDKDRSMTTKRMAVGVGLGLAAVVATACGSGSSGANTVASGSQPTTGSTPGSSASSSSGTSFSVATVAGLGTVVVDGQGHTVYVVMKGGTKNPPCTNANGCTAIWPALSLPRGASSASAGNGINASMLKSKMDSDGQDHVTYNGWLLYAFSGDSAAGQGNGQGVTDQWGLWHALTPAGVPLTTMPAAATTSSSSSGTGGYGY